MCGRTLSLLVDDAKADARVSAVERGEHAAQRRRQLGREHRHGDVDLRAAGVRAQRRRDRDADDGGGFGRLSERSASSRAVARTVSHAASTA